MMKIKILFFLLFISQLVGCKKDSMVVPDSKPEFVLNRIYCRFLVFRIIDPVKGDTVIKTAMKYGLDAYYHINYGLITRQIISFDGYIDSLPSGFVDPHPDIQNPPLVVQEFKIPNILGDLDSIKIYAKIYGVFYNDVSLTNSVGSFYRYDSMYASISRY